MKTIIVILFIFISFTSTAQNSTKFEHITCSHNLQYNINKFTQSQVGNAYNQYYLRAVWNINPDEYFVSGNVTYYFLMTENSNLISFDLHDTLSVDSVVYRNLNANFTRDNNVLEITLPNVLNQNDRDSISIYYKGVPTKVGGKRGSFAIEKYELNGDSIPCLWTLSEPYGAKDWFPCKQELYDKIDSCDLYFITPSKYKTAANGLLISEDTLNGKRTSHWQHKHPIATYLIGFVTSEFIENHRYLHLLNNDSVYMMEYSLKNDSSAITVPYDRLEELFNLFDTLFIPYPYMNEKYGHMQWKRPGGMEHQTMSSMDGMNWHNHVTIEHELMHQWFGDYITCGSWEDIWLNEGFAVFGNFLALEYLWDYWPSWYPNFIKAYHNSIISMSDGSVWVDDTTSVSRIFDGRLTYAKGGFLLRMLRWELGDEDFFNGVRAYLNNTDLQNGYARTSDIIYALEQAADTNLTEFFADWFYGEGHPIYDVKYEQNTDNYMSILINQSTSHSSVSFYEMTIPIQFCINGTDTIINFYNSTDNQLFGAQLSGVVDSLKFDPYYKIVSENTVTQSVMLVDNVNEIKIFPNPANNEITISLGGLPLNIENIYITNMEGKQSRLEYENLNVQKIDISTFEPGSYIISVETDKFSFNEKIIIE